MLSLTGCGLPIVSAGTAVQVKPQKAKYDKNTQVTWFDGKKENKADITVSAPKQQDEDPVLIDGECCPNKGVSSWYKITVVSKNSIKSIRPVTIADQYGNPISYNNITIDSSGYLGKDGCFYILVPNGYDASQVCTTVGNTTFVR